MRNRAKWFIHSEDGFGHDCSSISMIPNTAGWETDSGYKSYGLPKELAQWICDRLNESDVECPFTQDWRGWIKKGEQIEE